MADMFTTPPAKTPVVREGGHMAGWSYDEVYPINDITGNYASLAGREATFRLSVPPGSWIVPSQSRILMKLRIKRKQNDHAFVHSAGITPSTAYQSLRFAACPTAAMFSSMRFSCQGQTIEAVTNPHDLHLLRRKLRALPGVKNGTLGMENFSQRMDHRPMGPATTTAIETTNGNQYQVHDEDYNEKQRVITESVPLQAQHAIVGSSTYLHAQVGGADATDNVSAQCHEIEIAGAIPLSCWDQEKAFPYGSYELRATISNHAAKDALYTEAIPSAASGSFVAYTAANAAAFHVVQPTNFYGGGAVDNAALTNVMNQGNVCRVRPPVDAWVDTGNDELEIFVSEVKLLLCVAKPQHNTVPSPSSWQCVYDRLQLFHRTLTTGGKSFSENFVIPPSTRLLFIDMAPNEHTLLTNREMSTLARDVATLQVTYAGKIYPAPAYQLDMRNSRFSAARAYNDWLDVIGADVNHPVGSLSYADWCKHPVFAIRLLGEHLEASNNVQLKMSTHAGVAAGTDLRVFTASTVAWEMLGFNPAGPTEQHVDEIVG